MLTFGPEKALSRLARWVRLPRNLTAAFLIVAAVSVTPVAATAEITGGVASAVPVVNVQIGLN